MSQYNWLYFSVLKTWMNPITSIFFLQLSKIKTNANSSTSKLLQLLLSPKICEDFFPPQTSLCIKLCVFATSQMNKMCLFWCAVAFSLEGVYTITRYFVQVKQVHRLGKKRTPMKCNFSERQIEVTFRVKKFCVLDKPNNSVSKKRKSTPQSPDITKMRK